MVTVLSRPNAQTEGACCSPQIINAFARSIGLSPAEPYEIALGRELAAALFKGPIASAALMGAVQQITGSSLFAFKQSGAMTGFLGFFPVNAVGADALWWHELNALEFDLDWVSRPGERPAALYGWGFAGLTKRASAAVVSGLHRIQSELFWAIPRYARVASDQGARVVFRKMGYVASDGPDASLVWIPASSRGVAR